MQKIKTHKTVEQIAKKHRLDVSFIQKQLDMGEPIEHEHTQDHDLAKDIALQHLDEIPDYYTRLKKMEADAKKHHKKFKDVKINEAGSLHHWFKGSRSKDGKPGWVQADRSPCANEPGETKTPKCFSSSRLSALKRKGKKGESIIRSAVSRKRKEDPGQQQKSGASKPTNVPTFAKGRKSKDYVKPEPGLKEAMNIQEAEKDKPGKSSGKKDACYHKVKSRYSVWPSAYASGALVKCRKVGADNWGTKSESMNDNALDYDWNGPIREKAQRYCPKCEKLETRDECRYGVKYWDLFSVPEEMVKGKEDYKVVMPYAFPESYDHEYSMARSELSTIISAAKRLQNKMKKGEGNIEAWVQSKITKAADYIDAAADYVDSGEMKEQKLTDKILDEILNEKCWPGYKKKGMKTMFGKRYPNCVKAEDVTIEDSDGNTFAEVVDIINPDPIKGFKSQLKEATRLQSQTGNIIAVTLSWRGKYYAIRMFFPTTKIPTRQEVTYEIQKVYPDAKVVNHSISEFTPGQPLIQAGFNGGSPASPGPSKKYIKPYGEQVEFNEDWQKVNRQDKTDGLSQAAVNAYRRENPGSKLQTAVTEKNPTGKRADRRTNFCRRMKGMKSKLTSAKTARDPDSRINKALRRWNCN
jgi:hypothetical protein